MKEEVKEVLSEFYVIQQNEYYLTRSSRAVDFIVTDETKRLIQVCYDQSDRKSEAAERELAAIRVATVETGISDCAIVTDDEERETDGGTRIVPAWKLLFRINGDKQANETPRMR